MNVMPASFPGEQHIHIDTFTNQKFALKTRREAVSQLDKPAVSQTETHALGSLSVADTAASSGENNGSESWQWQNGNAAGRRLLGRRFEPWCGEHNSGGCRRRPPARIRTANEKISGRVCYHSTRCGWDTITSPIAWSLLSKNFGPHPHPTHPTPHQKSVIQC